MRSRFELSGRTALRALPLLFLLAAVPAQAWDVRSDASASAFSAFHSRFSSSAYFYPRHGAAPLGLTGFDVYADASLDQSFGDEPFASGPAAGRAVDGDLTEDSLVVARVGARKGLPGGIDLGLSYGKVLESDIKLISAELQWAILEGSAVQPALSLRVTGTRTSGSETYDLDQYGAELLLSKGFTVLTPYLGVGLVHSQGTLDRAIGPDLEETDQRSVLYGGVTLNLLLPKITVEIEKAEEVQYAARVAIGF